jgi:hypothetical protein
LQQDFPSSFLAQVSVFLQLALSLQHFLSANIVVVANNANATNNIFFIFLYFSIYQIYLIFEYQTVFLIF